MRISRFISALLLASSLLPAQAQEAQPSASEAQVPLFCGAAVFADLAGPAMKLLGTRFNQLEVGARVNLLDRYFPLVELGLGECDREGQENSNVFHTRAPYFRVGMDYNFNKKHNGNRFFGGLRYAFSSFDYDFHDPAFQDPVYGGPSGFALSEQHASMQWLEASIGCETKLWSFVRLGWTFRFKARVNQKGNDYGDPYYVPGYGKNGSTTWGGTCQLIFDVGKKIKH